ncbi:MAG: hypothetical protein QOK05_837 [Chloroflexota bacterium]|jgi:hypothetical protein|nr:hypothetical protein [Chloroflexota bacterium]
MAPGERTYVGSRIQKLGAKRGMRALLVDVPDPGLAEELAEAGVEVVRQGAAEPDLIFLGVNSEKDLDRIASYKRQMPPNGSLWLIRPKGKGTPVSESVAMRAGLDSGLVDVKVVSFSDTHSALKYVFRLRDR